MRGAGGKATHRLTGTPEHFAWGNMVQRCTNPKNPMYKYYGARGISVCERWRTSFEAFLADMGSRPSDQHSIERREVNGNYEPGNCYWATVDVQANNRRNNIFYEFEGKSLTAAEIARLTLIPVVTLRKRLEGGATVVEAIDKTRWNNSTYVHEGREGTLNEWSIWTGMPYHRLYKRLHVLKWSLEKTLATK